MGIRARVLERAVIIGSTLVRLIGSTSDLCLSQKVQMSSFSPVSRFIGSDAFQSSGNRGFNFGYVSLTFWSCVRLCKQNISEVKLNGEGKYR